MATIEQLNSALIKADAAGNTDDARALAGAIRQMRAAAPDTPPAREMSLGESAMQIPQGIVRGFQDVTDTGFNAGAKALDYLTGGNASAAVQAKAAEQQAQYDKVYQDSLLAGSSRLGGQLLATAPVGGLMAAPLRAVAPTAAQALASGGFAAKTMLGKAASGAAVGGASAGLVNPEDAGGGAAIGAVVPAAVAPIVKGLARVVGKSADMIRGNVPGIKAAELAQSALGDQLAPALNVLANARPGITATQALAEAGINADPFMALGGLAQHNDVGSWYRQLAQAQNESARNQLAVAAGGSTQTAARNALVDANKGVNALTTPMRETELAAANTAGQVKGRLEPYIGQKQASMESALQNQGRTATESAQAGVRNAEGKPGWISNADRSQEYGGAAQDFGVVKGQRQAERDFAQARVDSLAAHGLKPIDTDAIISNIGLKLKDPRIGPSDINTAVLGKVANKIEEWTARNGGVIDAEALYSIRKNAVGEEIQRLYPNVDAKAQAKHAAGLLNEIKPLIDDAIEQAGGTGWRDYLSAHATGMHGVEQQKLASAALKMFDSNPKKFVALVQGEDPKAVEKVFGPGSYDIVKEMGAKLAPLQDVAKQVSRDLTIAEQSKAGVGGLNHILDADQSTIRRAANIIGRGGRAAELTLEELEGKVNKKVIANFREGMKSGRTALDMLSKMPSEDSSPFLAAIRNTRAWNSGVTRAPALLYAKPNSLAPENRNALVR